MIKIESYIELNLLNFRSDVTDLDSLQEKLLLCISFE